MLLTTPTFLSFLEESSLRTNNSSSHIIIPLYVHHHPLSFSRSSFSLYHPWRFIVTILSPLLPQFSSAHFISHQSELYWFFAKPPRHISISLNSHKLHLYRTFQCFHFHTLSLSLTHIQPLPPSFWFIFCLQPSQASSYRLPDTIINNLSLSAL